MDLDRTAKYLFGLRRERRAVEGLPADLALPDLASGYRAQARLVDLLCEARGARRAGYKIALTNPAAQALLGVAHPVIGALIDADCHPSGVDLEAHAFNTRVIEVEFAFVMERDVPASATPIDAATIAGYVASLHPAIEIVDHRFAGLDRFDAPTLAADNAIHGAFVQGPAASGWGDLDLAAHPARLLVNGEEHLRGAGDRALGNPLSALAWLANALPEQGMALCAGDRVTTGLVTDGIYSAQAGDRLIGDLGTLGKVELSFR